tara:strand:- start:286 stop:546 length:261 start_codon:yes stop_codon:yes gene_type:complete
MWVRLCPGGIWGPDSLSFHGRGHLNRIDNLLISSAATEIPLDCTFDLISSWLGIFFHESGTDNQETRCAETTLAPTRFCEALLNWM